MAPPYLFLRVWTAGGPAHTLRLPGPTCVIGRSRSADVRLLAPEVSGSHVRLVSGEGGLSVEDLGSVNGTALGGAPLVPGSARPLVRGAVLQIGPYFLSASLSGPGEGDPPPDHGPEGTATLAAELLGELVAAGACQAATVQVCSPLGVQHRRILTPGHTLRIGRDPSCDLGVGDPDLSRLHAELRMTPSGVVAVDLGSKNGTYLGDERIAGPVALRSGDRLHLGGTELVYEDPAEAMLRELDGEADPLPDSPRPDAQESAGPAPHALPASGPPASGPPASGPPPSDPPTPRAPARRDSPDQGPGSEGGGGATKAAARPGKRASLGLGPLLLFALGLAVMAGALWALARLFL